MRVIAYIRCSTNEQADSGLGLDAQRAAVVSACTQNSWDVVEVIEDAGFSAGSLNRPGISRARQMLAAGEAEALVVSKLDRVSRSVLDAANLLETARREHWSIIALDLGVELGSPSGEMMAAVLVAMGQYERRMASVRTTDALAQAKQRGVKLGRPVTLADSTRSEIHRLREEGYSFRAIASYLASEGFKTSHGGSWGPSTVRKVLMTS